MEDGSWQKEERTVVMERENPVNKQQQKLETI